MAIELKDRPEALASVLARRANRDPKLMAEGAIKLSDASSKRFVARIRRQDEFRARSLEWGGKRVMR
jgi:hypothetical protein